LLKRLDETAKKEAVQSEQTDTTSENVESPIKRMQTTPGSEQLRERKQSVARKSIKKRNFRDLIKTPFRKKSIKRRVMVNSERR